MHTNTLIIALTLGIAFWLLYGRRAEGFDGPAPLISIPAAPTPVPVPMTAHPAAHPAATHAAAPALANWKRHNATVVSRPTTTTTTKPVKTHWNNPGKGH